MAASFAKPVPVGWSGAVATTPESLVLRVAGVAPSNETLSLAAPLRGFPSLSLTAKPASTIVFSIAGASNRRPLGLEGQGGREVRRAAARR